MTTSLQRRAHEGRGGRPRRTIARMGADEQATAARARRAWQRLASAGGVITSSQLAEAWQMTRQRVHQVTTAPEFPRPVIEGTPRGHPPLWLTAEVEQWRRTWTAARGPQVDRSALLDADPDIAGVRRAWRIVEQTGGLSTIQQLAATWGIARAVAARRAARDSFPPEVSPGRWLTAEALAAAAKTRSSSGAPASAIASGVPHQEGTAPSEAKR